jgi:hypothetical protein
MTRGFGGIGARVAGILFQRQRSGTRAGAIISFCILPTLNLYEVNNILFPPSSGEAVPQAKPFLRPQAVPLSSFSFLRRSRSSGEAVPQAKPFLRPQAVPPSSYFGTRQRVISC